MSCTTEVLGHFQNELDNWKIDINAVSGNKRNRVNALSLSWDDFNNLRRPFDLYQEAISAKPELTNEVHRAFQMSLIQFQGTFNV